MKTEKRIAKNIAISVLQENEKRVKGLPGVHGYYRQLAETLIGYLDCSVTWAEKMVK